MRRTLAIAILLALVACTRAVVPMATQTSPQEPTSTPLVEPSPTPHPTATPFPVGPGDVESQASEVPEATSTPIRVNPGLSFSLIVREIGEIPAYDRDDWRHWIDEDGDCQNARGEVLIGESRVPVSFDGCRVVSGDWLGLYTDTVVTSASSLDIDHMVPLSNAHRSGGWTWDSDKKREYANDLDDPDHLIAVTAGANRSKGDKGPEEWKPPDATYWCEYAIDWARIKQTWNLSVTQAEFNALVLMVTTCDVPVGLTIATDSGPVAIPSTPTPVQPTVTSTVMLTQPVSNCDPSYPTVCIPRFPPDLDCGEIRFRRFQVTGRDPHGFDRDRNGIGCES